MQLLDGKYQIDQLLGQGGMGAVYRATHLGTKRTVAVKVIHPQLSSHHEFLARFQREAEAAGRLRHPNVVDVTDFGFAQTEDGRVAYLVMEYLDGCTLAEIISEEGALPTNWVIDIVEQVCAAVDEAHRAGIIHRDLKPENIWLEPNGRGNYTVKVLDFGLVKLSEQTANLVQAAKRSAESDTGKLARVETEARTILQGGDEHATRIKSLPELFTKDSDSNGHGPSHPTNETLSENLTVLGSVMGTPTYMSPEQCRGEVLDSRSDIYSLGVITYRLLTGEPPFTGTFDELVNHHKNDKPTPIRERNHKVPKKLARIVMSALSKDPATRPGSAAGFASSMRAAWEGVGHLLRQAFALYSEYFPTFFKISLLGYAPLIVILAFINLSDKIVAMESLERVQQISFGIITLLGMIAALVFAYFSVTALTVPVVMQLMVAPLKAVQIKDAFAALKRRWKVFAITSLIVVLSIFIGTILFVVPGLIAALIYALYAPVAILEHAGVRTTLRRSRTLSRRALFSVVVITLIEFALPILVWRAAVITDLTFKLNDDWSPKEFNFNIATSGMSALYQLLNIFVTPLTAIMISLLYLKTRKSGGESLREASDMLDTADLPRSKWQLKMRSSTGRLR